MTGEENTMNHFRKFIVVVGSFLFLIILFTGIFKYVENKAMLPPANSPLLCENENSDLPIVALLGDSITHGRVSANYSDILEEKFKSEFRFINAGINSHLAYNLLNRLDKVIKCNPSKITILIGTNDVNSTLSEESRKRYIKNMELPVEPNKKWYEENLRRIIEKLQKETKADIAVLSLPLIGEDLNSTANKRVVEYSNIIQSLASEYKITYLPLLETETEFIKGKSVDKRDCANSNALVSKAVADHFLFGKSWDEISMKNEFLISTDCLHINSKGANMISDLISGFINSKK